MSGVPPPNCCRSITVLCKVIKIVAIRGRILKLKCNKYYFGGDYSAGSGSEPPSWKGPTSKVAGREGKEKEVRGLMPENAETHTWVAETVWQRIPGLRAHNSKTHTYVVNAESSEKILTFSPEFGYIKEVPLSYLRQVDDCSMASPSSLPRVHVCRLMGHTTAKHRRPLLSSR